MDGLKEFYFFSRLPPELRRPIWYFSLPGPRSIGYPGLEAREQVAVLQVNRESRQLALEHYELSEHIGKRRAYIDYKTDLIFESGLTFPEASKELRAELRKIHNLVLRFPSMNWLGDRLCRWFEGNLHLFTSLKHVIVRFRDPEEDGSFRAPTDEVDVELIYLVREVVDWTMKELKPRDTGKPLEALPLVTFEKVTWTKDGIRNIPLDFSSAIPPVQRP